MTEFALSIAINSQPGLHRPYRRPDLAGRMMRQAARQRLGVEPLEINAGHCPHVSQPAALASLLAQI